MPDLSILMPARNELFLAQTVETVLARARADTEVIVVLDGEWPDPPLFDHPKLRVTHSQTVVGQRGATNLAARMSHADYVMKLDAHCSVAEGFDVALIQADREIDRLDLTQIPRQGNLHAFNWRCRNCGRETYQGPTPTRCERKMVDGKPAPNELHQDTPPCGASSGFDRALIWETRKRRAKGNGSAGAGREVFSDFWRFDQTLHFQYWDGYRDRPAAQGDLVDVMSSLGACFFMRRARFFELGGLDEAHGSWGQYGTEIACKSWLSGGRHVVNKRTWFSHMFRTQGGDFGFPYPNPGNAQERARAHSRTLWIEGAWPGAKYPLSWLLQKFWPVPDWPSTALQDRTGLVGAAAAEKVKVVAEAASAAHLAGVSGAELGRGSRVPDVPDAVQDERQPAQLSVATVRVDHGGHSTPSTGLIYYSDCRGDQAVLSAVRQQLARAAQGRPIVAATLASVPEWPDGLVFPWERGYLTMFRQILAALEASTADVVFHCEHDVLYHPSHFDFTPARRDTFYYNQHTWRLRPSDGQALFYYCNQVSGLCAARELLLEHYRQRVAYVEAHGFDRNVGFEPGGNRRARALFGEVPVETWMSPAPNIDIKTEFCLTPGRWSQDRFRNKSTCQGWTEADAVPSWGRTRGRFAAFLAELGRRSPLERAG